MKQLTIYLSTEREFLFAVFHLRCLEHFLLFQLSDEFLLTLGLRFQLQDFTFQYFFFFRLYLLMNKTLNISFKIELFYLQASDFDALLKQVKILLVLVTEILNEPNILLLNLFQCLKFE